jgi:hypothetical protein
LNSFFFNIIIIFIVVLKLLLNLHQFLLHCQKFISYFGVSEKYNILLLFIVLFLFAKQYVEFLDVFYKTYKKLSKHLTTTTASSSSTDDKCLCITVNLACKTIPEVLTSEYSKQEGWKTTTDFIRWLFLWLRYSRTSEAVTTLGVS